MLLRKSQNWLSAILHLYLFSLLKIPIHHLSHHSRLITLFPCHCENKSHRAGAPLISNPLHPLPPAVFPTLCPSTFPLSSSKRTQSFPLPMDHPTPASWNSTPSNFLEVSDHLSFWACNCPTIKWLFLTCICMCSEPLII